MTHGHPYTGSMLGVQLFSCINAGYVIPVQNAFVCGRDRQFLQPCASDDLAVGKIGWDARRAPKVEVKEEEREPVRSAR